MPRRSLREAVGQRQREADPRSGEGFVDIDLAFVDEATQEELDRYGGRWDRRKARFIGVGVKTVPLHLHRGQLDAARWFVDWLDKHLARAEIPDEERVYSLMLGGGQRSGKTYLGVGMAVSYAVAVANSIVWIVSPSAPGHEEVQDYLRRLMPRRWYRSLGAPHYRYELANGSKIVLRSGHDPDTLKKGDADLVVINEAQQQHERAFVISRGRIAASGGLVVVCANPPSEAIGQWVGDFAADAQAGLRKAKFFHLDPMDNPHIDPAPLLELRNETDEHTFDTEVRGLFLGAKNAVLYNWSRTDNEIAPPLTGDITAEFTKHFEGRAYDRVVSVDVQRHPFMASCEWRFFENPRAQTGTARFEWCWMWGVSEFFLKGADEEALGVAWLESGWDPSRTLVVCDASAEWQFAERDPTKLKALRERVKGRGSFDVFRRLGFTVVKPDRSMEKNPEVIERVRATASRIKTAVPNEYGQHFYFIDPRCREVCKAVRNWSNKNGMPMRVSQWAHGGDVATYPVQRFFPRREVRATTEVEVVKRFQGPSKMRGW